MEASPDPEWDAGRVGVAYEQARAVVDAQEQTLQDIDDKAVRVVRVTVVLFGVLVSVVGLLIRLRLRVRSSTPGVGACSCRSASVW